MKQNLPNEKLGSNLFFFGLKKAEVGIKPYVNVMGKKTFFFFFLIF